MRIIEKRKLLQLVALLILLSAGCLPAGETVMTWSGAKTTHQIVVAEDLSVLWERPIYTGDSPKGTPCTAMGGYLYLLGSETVEGPLQLIAIEGQTGKTIWTKVTGDVFTHSETQLFVGDKQKVIAIDPMNGSENWTTVLFVGRTIGALFYDNEQLFINVSGAPFFILDPTNGDIIQKYRTVESFRQEFPDLPFYPSDFETILVDEGAILVFGDKLYSVIHSSLSSDEEGWRIRGDSLSNAAVIGDRVFYISKTDSLKAVDVNTGQAVFEAAIEPPIDFLNLEKEVYNFGYYVCGDEENGLLYVILGDSRQLIALSVGE